MQGQRDKVDKILFILVILQHSRASNSKINCTIWPKFELARDFMPVLKTCKFEALAITIERAVSQIRSNIYLFRTEGQVTLRRIVQYGQNSKVSKI